MAGKEHYYEAGERWFPELEITFVLAALHRTTYDDNPSARIRRHFLAYGPPGSTKSSLTKAFLEGYCGSIDLGRTEDEPDRSFPLHLTLAGKGGVSWERTRGGISPKGVLLQPLLREADFYYVPEMFSWIGHRKDEQAEKIDAMNEIMEEGRVTVSQLQTGDIGKKITDEQAEEWRDNGFFVNRRLGMFSYDVTGSAIMCSRTFTPEQERILDESGFSGRTNKIWWNPSPDEFRKFVERGPGPPSPRQQAIREFNLKVWRTDFLKVCYPPQKMIDYVRDVQRKVFNQIEMDMGISAVELRSMRELVDCAQLITARAVVRTVATHDYAKNGNTVTTLLYEESDAAWAASHMKKRMQPIYDEWSSKIKVDAKAAEERGILTKYLEETNRESSAFHAKDFVAWQVKNTHCHQATGYNRIKRMVDRGWLLVAEAGEYIPAPEIAEIVSLPRFEDAQ